MEHLAKIHLQQDTHTFYCEGNWSILSLAPVLETLQQLPSETPPLYINGKSIEKLDSAGALALLDWRDSYTQGQDIQWIDFKEQHLALITRIEHTRPKLPLGKKVKHEKSFLYRVGLESHLKYLQAEGLLSLIGDLSLKIYQAFGQLRRFQLPSIASNIDTTGIQALPILALLSFLIGIVLAYQMGLQLQTYGANIFIAFLSGMAIFREFSPLITAIIVAGRTSSSFTAQIGSMKINEEIDAIQTMGLSPTELLVMPKVLGLLIVFPLLIFWSDMFSLIGAMVMSKFMLNVSYYDFLMRLKESVGLKQMMLGLYKAPAFAILIALVGCFQGLRVEANASSIGSQTTKSVVQAIFLIIITDAIFSVVYSWLDL